ncbi:unnamed protein product [Dibothriocephalus latus]|uniref:Uncharacterized protein n=1 Tax=Dibothriocephalus latus TaxID=60516 RepID=A0A3P7LRT5_DIBLA|nr:unnamed protein product [Dibothriocephalus latus]
MIVRLSGPPVLALEDVLAWLFPKWRLKTRIAEYAAAVQRDDANSQVLGHSMRSGQTFKFDEPNILARGDNHVSRELLESWFTGLKSIKNCSDLPNLYSVLRLKLAQGSRHLGNGQATTSSQAKNGRPHGRVILTRDEISAGQSPHTVQQTINKQEGNYR